jgi:ATP-dependent Lon protease
VDNYIDLPVDLSNVLFICSANYERNISKPLLDRMEKIYLNSYTDDEKQHIFANHLLRRAIAKTGVSENQFDLTPEVVYALIHEYSRGEPGVRRLEKNIEKILERVAFKIV